MELKYLEWNLHAMGGIKYTIPSFIPDYIKDVDVFVLVEFCASKGFDGFRERLKDFDLYCSPYTSKGYNQVCIGLRKSLKYTLLSTTFVDICNMNIPEFMQVDIGINEKEISVIGTRIKTDEKCDRNLQFDFLREHLAKLGSYICLGDFNVVQKTINKKLSCVGDVYGPRYKNGYYSFVHADGGTCSLDWLLTKNVQEVYNGYPDAEKSPYATYDWSFVSDKNGYGTKSVLDYRLPDHAILKGMIKI